MRHAFSHNVPRFISQHAYKFTHDMYIKSHSTLSFYDVVNSQMVLQAVLLLGICMHVLFPNWKLQLHEYYSW